MGGTRRPGQRNGGGVAGLLESVSLARLASGPASELAVDVKTRITLLKRLRIVLVIVIALLWYDVDLSTMANAVTIGAVSSFGFIVILYVSIVIVRLEDLDNFL